MKCRQRRWGWRHLLGLGALLLVGLIGPAWGGVGGTAVYYLHTDHLNTPRLVTDEAGQVVWRNTPLAEPFGTAPHEEDPDGDGQPFVLNLRFPGQYFDRETNLNYNYYRDYDPRTGRYIQSDPIGLRGGINTYSYVGGNPMLTIDPLGQDAIIAHAGTATYYNSNGTIVGMYPYTTGRPGVTDTSVSGQGPIPLGTYTADPSQISEGGWLRNLLGDWGRYRVPLQPDQSTETFGRSGFFLHGGRKPGSAGCIDVGSSDKNLFENLRRASGLVPIVVY